MGKRCTIGKRPGATNTPRAKCGTLRVKRFSDIFATIVKNTRRDRLCAQGAKLPYDD